MSSSSTIDRSVAADGAPAPIAGECDPRFEPVLEAFCENFDRRRELGAAVMVYWQGEKVVDLWGGHRDPDRTMPWEALALGDRARTLIDTVYRVAK